MVGSYGRIAGLPLEIESCSATRREMDVSSGFTRVTTTVTLAGGGHQGLGEDVTYDAADHDGFPAPDLAGRTTLDGLSRELGELDLFPESPPGDEAYRHYRRWAFESAALDLALRQSGLSLAEALGRDYRPVRFVVSTRLDPRLWLAIDPALEFKLDPTSEWTDELIDALAATGRVRVLDLKAHYSGTSVDQPLDLRLYETVARRFPEAVIEDPALATEALAVLSGALDRLSFDAPIHSLRDIDALPVAIRHVNVKPSRFGSLERLLECLDGCERRGIAMYGGGQFELGVGRGQIQALASLFYPDAANDVAPGSYNAPEPVAGLPASPLAPPAGGPGFSWP